MESVPALSPRMRAGLADKQREQPLHRYQSVAHEPERERQQQFGACRARLGVGEGQALLLGPARIVPR